MVDDYSVCCEIVEKLKSLGDEEILGNAIITLCAWSSETQKIFINNYGDVLE